MGFGLSALEAGLLIREERFLFLRNFVFGGFLSPDYLVASAAPNTDLGTT
jgi:hypothetical protein